MIVKMTRVTHAEIGDDALEQFKKCIKQDDEATVDILSETEFDSEGIVVDYLIFKQSTTVEVDTSGEFKPTITPPTDES